MREGPQCETEEEGVAVEADEEAIYVLPSMKLHSRLAWSFQKQNLCDLECEHSPPSPMAMPMPPTGHALSNRYHIPRQRSSCQNFQIGSNCPKPLSFQIHLMRFQGGFLSSMSTGNNSHWGMVGTIPSKPIS